MCCNYQNYLEYNKISAFQIHEDNARKVEIAYDQLHPLLILFFIQGMRGMLQEQTTAVSENKTSNVVGYGRITI